MHRKKLEKKYIVLIILILVTLFLALIFTIIKSDHDLNPIEQSIKDSVSFVGKIIYKPINFAKEKIAENKEKDDLYEKYQEQQEKLANVDNLETKQRDLESQLKEMKELLNLNQTLVEYEYLNATVINRNVGYWYNTLTIDKGSHNGIETDMVVVNSTGLIGKVVSTTNFTSEVRLITTSDTNNKISVSITNGENKLNGLINGYDYENKTLEVEGISNTEEVAIGDKVYTSGLGGVFPSGILIGTVESINTDEYDLAKIINVKPSADFDDINYVSILKRKSDQ